MISPIPIPEKEPPAPIIVKSLLAWRGLNTSPASIQNCKIDKIVTISIQI